MNTYGFHSIHGRAPDDRDRAEGDASGAQRLGRDRRRRRAEHRRQSPAARAAPQRRPPDHPAQQRDLRSDEGPVLADIAARQAHEVVAHRLDRRAAAAAVRGARRRGDLRGALDRHRRAADAERPAAGISPPRHLLRRGVPELQHLQRRRLRRLRGQGSAPRPDDRPRARQADGLRQRAEQGHPARRGFAGDGRPRRCRDVRGRPARARRDAARPQHPLHDGADALPRRRRRLARRRAARVREADAEAGRRRHREGRRRRSATRSTARATPGRSSRRLRHGGHRLSRMRRGEPRRR